MPESGKNQDVPVTTPTGEDPKVGEEPKRARPRWLPSLRLLSGIFVLAGIVVFSLKAHSVAHEFSTVLGHFNVHRLPWLAAAIGAEVLSFWCYALVQRNLLLAGGARLSGGLACAISGKKRTWKSSKSSFARGGELNAMATHWLHQSGNKRKMVP